MPRSFVTRILAALIVIMVPAILLPDLSHVPSLSGPPAIERTQDAHYGVLPLTTLFDKQTHRIKRGEDIRPKHSGIAETVLLVKSYQPGSNPVLGYFVVNDCLFGCLQWACRILDRPPPAPSLLNV